MSFQKGFQIRLGLRRKTVVVVDGFRNGPRRGPFRESVFVENIFTGNICEIALACARMRTERFFLMVL